MEYDESIMKQIRSGRARFLAMSATYVLGVFNDNFFKQVAMLMAVSAGYATIQGDASFWFSVPYVLFSSYAGWLADRFSKGKVVMWAKFLELAAMIVGAVGVVTTSWRCMIAMVFMMALQSTLFGPALNGSIPELYPAVYVPKANSFIRAATTMAVVVGIGLGGLALTKGTGVVAVAVVLVALAGAASSFGVHKQPPAGKTPPFPWAGPLISLRDTWRLREDVQLVLAIVCSAFFYSVSLLAVLVINLFAIRQMGYPETTASFLMGTITMGICVGSLAAGKLVTCERWTRLLGISALGMGAGLILAGLTPSIQGGYRLPVLYGLFLLTGACGGLFLIPVASFIQVRPAAGEKGRVLGVTNFWAFSGMAVTSLVYKKLCVVMSPAGTLIMSGLVAVVFAAMLTAVLFLYKRFDGLAAAFVRKLLGLRYRISVSGLETVRNTGRTGILFLPNHPALIDPVILSAILFRDFRARPMADRDQSDRPLIRTMVRRLRAVIIPDLTKGGAGESAAVRAAVDEVIEGLRDGDNFLLYPSGHIYRSKRENVGGNSAVEQILKQVPECRVVLVRTRGLWGSSFGYAGGKAPRVGPNIRLYLAAAVCNLLLFIPRRRVTVEFLDPDDFPRSEDRLAINTYLERFYNEDALPNTHVPYFWWRGRRPQVKPEPQRAVFSGDTSRVPSATRQLVIDYLRDITGIKEINDTHHLARDLAMDSLVRVELMAWMTREFGLPQDDFEALQTVGDCLLAACGETVGGGGVELKPVPAAWFKRGGHRRLDLPEGGTIGEAFLRNAASQPGVVAAADQISGALSYRRIITGILALKPEFEALPGDALGIMLPPTATAVLVYLAVMFAGKTPVMVNWTVGEGHMSYCLDRAGVSHIVTSRKLLERLKGRGFDAGAVDVCWVALEDVGAALSPWRRLAAFLRSWCSWRALRRAKLSETACILFTSGSEANPKAVPLSHGNILSNIRSLVSVLPLYTDDRLLGMLPPFHSLGLTGTVIMPCVLGVKTVYYPDPTAAAALAGVIAAYRPSILAGTPTFLNGIVRASAPGQLASLRLVVTGAEKCPEYVYRALGEACPNAVICEGYGITECSPVVCINRPDDPRPGTIGPVIPSMEYAVIDPESETRVVPGEQGMLLVRGPNVFAGYLGAGSKSPSVSFEGRQWYRTGDLVSEDPGGVLTFRGRLKRFIKLGGEMISLPAVESVLERRFAGGGEGEGPVLAVEATPVDEYPEIVLFTTLELDRESANRSIRQAGLSALHNVRRVIMVETIPVLGTGKTDYRELKRLLSEE